MNDELGVDAVAAADHHERRALKLAEDFEHNSESEPESDTVPVYSVTSAHLRRSAHRASLSSSTLGHVERLFGLSEPPDADGGGCCHWCHVSASHRRAHTERYHRRRSYVTFVAPMVRYGKLPFRLLCREYGADCAYTPMIIATGFNRSQQARKSEFSTNHSDQPLIAQFGVNDPVEFAKSAEIIAPYCQGIDINCGCPQQWALSDGIGAALIKKPELVASMIQSARAVTSLPLSIKIRIQTNLTNTVELVRRAESAGVDFIAVHGRTVTERRSPVNLDAIKLVKSVASVPIIANGDVHTPQSMESIAAYTGVDGLMSARGILANPALFDGRYLTTPMAVIRSYLRLAYDYGGKFSLHHHHFMYMIHSKLTRAERFEFMTIKSLPGIEQFFERRGWHWSGADQQPQQLEQASNSVIGGDADDEKL